MSTNPTAVLETRDLAIEFGGIHAVDGVDLVVQPGQVVGLIGPNGAGKTTLLNLITGVYTPSRGEVVFAGKRVDGTAPYQRARGGIARTFQNIRLFTGMTVLEHLHIALESREPAWRTITSFRRGKEAEGTTLLGSIPETLTALGLWADRDRLATELSYGAQRRLEIARALALQPRLLLLDEPAAGMNDDETMEVAELIRDLSARGLSVLLIEHNMPFVSRTCEVVTVINFGKHLMSGTPEEIRKDPRVLEAYLGADDE